MNPVSSLDAYEKLARYYDLQHRSFTEDYPLYTVVAAEIGAAINILELGAGTGRIMLPLVQAGHRVVGVDESGEMLDIAARHLRPFPAAQYALIMADARLWRSAERFDLCIIALNTFLHNLSRADQLATLRTAHDHLKPGGVLVIDLPPNDELAHQPDDGEYEFETKMIDPQAKTELEKYVASHVFWASQEQALSYRITESSQHSQEVTEVSFRLRHVWRHEMELLLINSGFDDAPAWWGDYARAPYEDDSRRMIMRAIRASR